MKAYFPSKSDAELLAGMYKPFCQVTLNLNNGAHVNASSLLRGDLGLRGATLCTGERKCILGLRVDSL